MCKTSLAGIYFALPATPTARFLRPPAAQGRLRSRPVTQTAMYRPSSYICSSEIIMPAAEAPAAPLRAVRLFERCCSPEALFLLLRSCFGGQAYACCVTTMELAAGAHRTPSPPTTTRLIHVRRTSLAAHPEMMIRCETGHIWHGRRTRVGRIGADSFAPKARRRHARIAGGALLAMGSVGEDGA